eukprot:g47191.t1
MGTEIQEGEGGIGDASGRLEVGAKGGGKVNELFKFLMGTRGGVDTVIDVAEEEVLLEQFINFTSTFYTNLKFTWTISDTSLEFLDLSVSIS